MREENTGLKRSIERLKENVNDARAARSRIRWAIDTLLHEDIFQRELTKHQMKDIKRLLKVDLRKAHTAADRAKIAFRIMYRIFNRPEIKAKINSVKFNIFKDRYNFVIYSNLYYRQKADWLLDDIQKHLQTLVTELKLTN